MDEFDDVDFIDSSPDVINDFEGFLRQALERINSDKLKKMAVAWGGDYKLRKEQCIAFMLAALRSPEHIRRTLAACTPFERAMLAVFKSGTTLQDSVAVTLCAAMLAVDVPKRRYASRFNPREWLLSLFEKGLVFSIYGNYDYAYNSLMPGATAFVVDPRLSAEVRPLNVGDMRRLDVQPAPRPAATLMRRPQSVSLSHGAFLRTLQGIGALKINKTGERRLAAASLTKLGKALDKQGWDNIPATLSDGTPIATSHRSATNGTTTKARIA